MIESEVAYFYGEKYATYSYVANSALVSQIEFKNNGTPKMSTAKQYDKLNRLTSISSIPSDATQLPLAYVSQYNSANQRVRVGLHDGSYWIYDYDGLGQVKSGKKYFADNTPVPGQQFEYAHDDIGNRISTGGRASAQSSYNVNSRNQYTSRTVAGGVDVVGAANAVPSVTVNGTGTDYRRGEYWHKYVSVDNSVNPVWQNVSVTTSGGGSASGYVFVPKDAEGFDHDLDGNLLYDGRWDYTWDAENRLIRLLARTSVGIPQQIEFEYDWRGRRIGKKVWDNIQGTGNPALTRKFLYDQWNLVAELDNNNAVMRSYVWGTDLSGFLQGAGGVGGLLTVQDAVQGTHFAAYDLNGNVMGLVKAADGTWSAQYEYGPFGEVIRATGPMAKANPFRFSTKYQDDESDLLYYGFRYFNASTGRWQSRDPIGERGFELIRSDVGNSKLQQGEANLYLLVSNDALSKYDYLGLNPNIAPGTTFTVKLQGGGKVTVTVGSKFSQAEQDTGRRGLCMVRKLLGFPPYLPPFSDTYWAAFTRTSIDGLTYNGSIFISSNPKPTPCNFVPVANFGALLAHEADHYYTDSNDVPGGPDDRINTPVLDAMRKALSEGICGCCGGQWQIENLLGKYACDCGLTPCKPKPCRKPQ